MDMKSLLGWAVMVAVLPFFVWRMRAQLEHLQYGKRRTALLLTVPFRTAHVTLYGVGSVLYAALECLSITTICFFALHIGYVMMMPYRLEQARYGLVGIVVCVAFLDLMALVLRWLRVGHKGASDRAAAAWVSLMIALLALGAAAIVYSEGKLLVLLPPSRPGDVIAGFAILGGAFVVSLVAVNFQARATRLI